MNAPIVLTGLAPNDPVPGRYFETNFAVGPTAAADGPVAILLIGNKTTAGSGVVGTQVYGPDTPVTAQTEGQYIAITGPGSPIHRSFLRITKVTKDIPIYFVLVAESAGAAATGTIVLTNAATADGTIRIWVGDESVDVSVANGDAIATIGAAMAAAVNGMTAWAVTATFAVATLTLTAKCKGTRGNFLRYMAAVISQGVIATTVTATADTAMSGGTTADTNVTALSTVLPQRFYYIVSEAEDATQFGAVVSQVNAQAAPTTGIRQRCVGGSIDTISNTVTVATGRNSARAELLWQKASLWTPFELAANAAAIYAMEELNDETSFVEYGNDAQSDLNWNVPPPRDVTAWPTRTDIKTALNNGITPIAVNARGSSTYLVNRVTTRSLSGSTTDYRIRPAHKVTIVDKFGDALAAKTTLQFARHKIADDLKKGQKPGGGKFVRPANYKMAIFGLIDTFVDRGLIDVTDAQQIKDETVTQREANPRTRLTGRVPLRPVENCEQFATALDQVAGFLLFLGALAALAASYNVA
jgi:phage tail sheath gpL-like